MAYIQLPVGTFHHKDAVKQVDSCVDILRTHLPDRKTGLQLYAGGIEEGRPPFHLIGDMIEYSIGKDLAAESLTVHHPFAARNPNKNFNFYYPESSQTLREMSEIVEKHNVKRMTIHFSTCFFPLNYPDLVNGFQWKEDWDDLQTMQSQLQSKAFEHLQDVTKDFKSIHFGVENMPLPLRGDRIVDPKRILVEPLMHSSHSVDEFLKHFRNQQNVGICLDTAHYLLSKVVTDKHVELPGVWYPRGISVPLLQYTKKLAHSGKLFDLQLTDATCGWEVGKQVMEEGAPLLEGMGGRGLIDVAKAVIDLDIGFSLDLNPQRKNYSDSEWENRYSLKKEQIVAIELLKKEGVF
ncbi:MAG: hypothetical protein CMH61_00930 [Nanoarchaeota archaeon]|nr:hypothetical protein [Nanoarchaeota archaeon]|tara:strand:- start:3660 stop:4709 length:1050 start_codon:yes stop_codon:yes gene_type:complete